MAREQKFKFAKRVYAKKGKLSSVLSGVSLCLFLIGSILSFALRGKAGVYVGGLSLMAILFSAYGFYLGLSGYSEKNCSHVFCTLGSIANGMLMVLWLALFLIGV